MICNRRAKHTVAIAAGTTAVLIGRDDEGNGGREGVLNGATSARLHVYNTSDAPLTVRFFTRATRGGLGFPQGSAWIAADQALVALFDREDCAAYELLATAQSGSGQSVVVEWGAFR